MSDRPRRPDVFEVASGVSLAITDSPDLDAMLSVIARRVAEALGVWECNIYEYRPENDTLVATALWAPELTVRDREWLGTVYAVAERPSYQRLLRERGVREVQADDPSLRAAEAEIMRRWGELSVLSVPLLFQDDVIGALTLIEKRAPRRFSPADLRLLEILAVPAAVAVYNARMFRREADQNRRLQALLSAGRAMTSTIRLDDLSSPRSSALRVRRSIPPRRPSTPSTLRTTPSRSSRTIRGTPNRGGRSTSGARTRWSTSPTVRRC